VFGCGSAWNDGTAVGGRFGFRKGLSPVVTVEGSELKDVIAVDP